MNAIPWQQPILDGLKARHPAYDFWHVPTSHGPDYWCWRPAGSTDGRQSQHRGAPEQVEAAITGTEGKRRAPARTHAETEAAPE